VRNTIIRNILIASFLSFFSTGVMAQVFDESSDASALLASATPVPPDTVQITGDITNSDTDADADVFQITVMDDGLFTIEAIADIDGQPDMNLIVFNNAGQGLAGDDDDNNNCITRSKLKSLDSCLTLNLTAGTYYIAVGDNNIGAFESIGDYQVGNDDFIDNDSGILSSPTTEIAVVVGTEGGPNASETEGSYVINLNDSPSSVPIPATSFWMLALLAGLIGLMGLHQFRTS